MRIATLTSVAALALAAAACNSNDSESASELSTEANLTEDMAANDALGADTGGAATPTDAQGFATAVAASDLYEIESAKLAASKSASTEVKELAGHLLTDHQKSTAELKAAASKARVTVAPALDPEKKAMIDQLKAASGAEFDRLFIQQQKTAHQKALALLQSFAREGDTDPLKAFARKASGVVEGHIEHLNGLRQPS